MRTAKTTKQDIKKIVKKIKEGHTLEYIAGTYPRERQVLVFYVPKENLFYVEEIGAYAGMFWQSKYKEKEIKMFLENQSLFYDFKLK